MMMMGFQTGSSLEPVIEHVKQHNAKAGSSTQRIFPGSATGAREGNKTAGLQDFLAAVE